MSQRNVSNQAQNKALYDWIQVQLNIRGWNQKILSDRMGMSASTISRLGANNELPRLDTLKSLSEALQVPLSEVMVMAGVLEPTTSRYPRETSAVIANDPRLNPDDRSALIHLYNRLAAPPAPARKTTKK